MALIKKYQGWYGWLNGEKSKCTVNCELEVPVTTEFLELQASLPTREGFEELLGGFDSVRRGYFLGTTSRSDLI